MTGLRYERVVLLNIAVTLALKGPNTLVADHNLTDILQQAIREGHVPAGNVDKVTETVADLLPPIDTDPTVGAYVGQLRQIAQGLT